MERRTMERKAADRKAHAHGEHHGKKPYSWLNLALIGAFFGMPGAYIVTWQNLKRIGTKEEADRFCLLGFLIMLGVFILAFVVPDSYIKGGVAAGLGIMFPVWLYYKKQKAWEIEHPGEARFQWISLAWGLLGTAIWLVAFFAVSFALFVGTEVASGKALENPYILEGYCCAECERFDGTDCLENVRLYSTDINKDRCIGFFTENRMTIDMCRQA